MGLQDKLYIGNLNSKRDWGHAKDYVEVMWMILQSSKPDDWVIATGKTYTVRDFIKLAFKYVEVQLEFIGEGINEKAIVKNSSNKNFLFKPGQEVVLIDPKYFRPSEVDILVGDSSKAKKC